MQSAEGRRGERVEGRQGDAGAGSSSLGLGALRERGDCGADIVDGRDMGDGIFGPEARS